MIQKAQRKSLISKLWLLLTSTRLNRVILITGYFIGISIVVYLLSIPGLSLFPNSLAYKGNSYTDENIGGNSEVIASTIHDTTSVIFQLDTSFTSPYVGVTYASSSNQPIDLSRYNLVKIDARVENLRGLSMAIFAPHDYNNPDINPESLMSTSIDMNDHRTLYIIPFSAFKIPDWWYHINELEESKTVILNLSAINSINFGSINTPKNIGKSSFTIYKVSFTRDNTKAFYFIGMVLLFLPVLVATRQYFITKLNLSTQNITVAYKPTADTTHQPSSEIFMQYLNENFHHSDLTIEQVSKETGTNDRRIAQYIQSHFDCNFKTYINRIRVAESKRLLTSTDFNAGEIAFRVGFTNQSHFNRVFKNLEQMSPLQYRKLQKQD